MGVYPNFLVSGRSAVFAGDVQLPRNLRLVWTWLDSCVVAVGTRVASVGLGRHLMSVHRFPQKTPAASTLPCLRAATNFSETPSETPPGSMEFSWFTWNRFSRI